jgi:ketosteroid isomerase-like protein
MRMVSSGLAIVLCAGTVTAAQSPSVDQIRALDSIWTRSYFTHDTAAAKSVLSPDIFITSSNGSFKNREAELNDVREYPGTTVNYFRSTDVTVRPYQGTAAVTGQLEWETTTSGRASAVRRRYTAVYAPGGPRGWQMVVLHIGPAATPR